jgi:dihydroorotase
MRFCNATLPDGRVRDLRIEGEIIVAVGEDLEQGNGRTIDATDKRLFPGAIDVHVHFREPGFSHKETWRTGSESAAAGGVTTVVDQPNTDPPTVDGPGFDEKARLAEASIVDYGLNGGVTEDWDPDSLFDRSLLALGEVFLADSTGDMGIDAELFAEAVGHAGREGVPVTVHAEDADLFDEHAHERAEADSGQGHGADAARWSDYRTPDAEAAAVEQACEVAAEYDTPLHVAHTSTPEGIDAASVAGATCEVTPHHLLLSREDLEELGSFGRMNPPLRSAEHRQAVYERVADGTVDVIATDHAPHTRQEKEAQLLDAPSGVPGVETMLPLLLEEARQGRLDYERVRDLVAGNPAAIFDLPNKGRIAEGTDADLVLFDPENAHEIRGRDLHSKCEWTPFEGRQGVFPELTLVRGRIVYDGEGLAGEPGFADVDGRNVRE